MIGELPVSRSGLSTSPIDRYLVSGAHAIETIVPINRIALIAIIDGPIPHELTLTGNRKVPIAEPMRLTAVVTPTPVPRISVGKSSAG